MTPLMIAALAIQLNLSSVLHGATRAASAPSATCHISTVSYRFVGEPGTQFRYDGDAWTVPASGAIELIAGRASEYQIAGKSLPLLVWPRDEFGMRSVPLPRSN
jgi:hypothetical protein